MARSLIRYIVVLLSMLFIPCCSEPAITLEDALAMLQDGKKVKRGAQTYLSATHHSVDEAEDWQFRLQVAFANMSLILSFILFTAEVSNVAANEADSILLKVEKLKASLRYLIDRMEARVCIDKDAVRYCPPDVYRGGRGRPKKDISQNVLEHFLDLGFSVPAIAEILGVSKETIKRRKKNYGLSFPKDRMDVGDDALDVTIKNIWHTNPRLGVIMIEGQLRASGIWVTRRRIRSSMTRLECSSRLGHRFRNIYRRKYNVPAPMCVWHIDGNHKLVKLAGIFIHGCIDGFSRKIIYMFGATNNKSETVANLFLEATTRLGWPSRIRTDAGGENFEVGQLMVDKWGAQHKAHLVGKSVHNQRIERLWVDVRHCVTQVFMDAIDELILTSEYSPDAVVQKLCIQKIFLPVLNKRFADFIEQWNNHKLSSEHQRSPNQLWTEGMMKAYHTEAVAVLSQERRNEIEPISVDEMYAVEFAPDVLGEHGDEVSFHDETEHLLERHEIADKIDCLLDPNISIDVASSRYIRAKSILQI